MLQRFDCSIDNGYNVIYDCTSKFCEFGDKNQTFPLVVSSNDTVSEVIKQVGGFPTRGYAGDTIGTYIIDYGTVRFEMGYACTLSVVLFLIMILTNSVITKLLRKNLND